MKKVVQRLQSFFRLSQGFVKYLVRPIIAGWVGMAAYGGYLGMWDWAVVWPVMTAIMKYLSYFGIAAIVIVMILIPQIQYKLDKDKYFLITEDFEAYKAKKASENR